MRLPVFSRRGGSRCAYALVVALAWVSGTSIAAPPSPAVLPLQRLRMYDSGVAYFERAGTARSGELTLPVPSAHLDDALKSLVVLSEDGRAKVERVDFASAVSREMGEALSGLPEDAESRQLLAHLAGALRGAEVELEAKGVRHRGRVLGVDSEPAPEPAPPTHGGGQNVERKPEERRALVILSHDGALRRVAFDEVSFVRVVDPHRAGRLHTALDAVSASSKLRSLRLVASGQSVRLGYVAQAPVWRSSYRLVLGSSKASPINGWALIHNDTDEDWVGVRLELVNGRPSSFLLPMAAPRYIHRDTMPLEDDLNTVPQLLDVTVDGMQRIEGSGRGEGFGFGGIGTLGGGRGVGAPRGPVSSARLVLGNLADTPAAEGVEAGSLFLYAPSSPLTLAARHSAMVPFVDATVTVRQVAWLDEPEAAAQRAVLLENTTGQTLPPGTLAVFADGGFAGEAPLDRLKPSERRLVPFGADLDVEVHQRARTEHASAKIVEARDDTLIEHYVRKRVTRYEVVNKSGSSRTVVLKVDAVSNARVTGANAVGFDEARQRPYAQFDAVARQRAERTLVVEEGLERRHPREKVTARLLRRLAATASERNLRERLLRAATELGTAESLREEVSRAGVSLGRTLEDLASLRLSMQALYGKAGADEIAARIVQAETQGSGLRARRVALRARALAGERRAWEILRRGA